MFTFNFTFHVPNPFSMSTLTSVANAATDAFNSVATDIRDDPDLLNYMVAGLGPGGVAGGFGYDYNRLIKSPPPSSSTSHSSHTSPKSKGLKSPRNKHTVGLGLANPHAQTRKRYMPGRNERHRGDFQHPGSTTSANSGFVFVNPTPPGSGTPKFPTQPSHYSQYGSYLDSVMNLDGNGPGQGLPASTRLNHPWPESRKRGWVPASSEPSYASTNEDFTTGFFDTPKYSDVDVDEMGGVNSRTVFGGGGRVASASGVGDRRKRDDGNDGGDAVDAELPPAKRRKGLAGSIFSTALSAALIGTAVGLTVYRLWKDRGRADGAPPPPYEESERSHQHTHDSKTFPSRMHPDQMASNLKSQRRRHAATAGRRVAGNTVRHRKPIPQRFHASAYGQQPGPSQPVHDQDVPFDPFSFGHGQTEEASEEEPEDQMDWIGGRISQLIEDGKKALGAEVVVMSDVKEDEVDDGSGLWEDSDGGELAYSTSSRYGRTPPRRKRARQSLIHQSIPGGLGSGEFSPSNPPAYASPTKSTFSGSPGSVQPLAEPVSGLASSTSSVTGWMRETDNDWQSEEVKESMERARAMYLAKKRGQVVG